MQRHSTKKGDFQTLKEGFEKHVVRTECGCWKWNGVICKNPGYPQFMGDGKLVRAHRASWELHFGEVPKGMCVCHTCDNRECTNPEHLFLGTCKDNNLDMMKKGRHPTLGKRGFDNLSTKLTASERKEIIEKVRKGAVQWKIAKEYGISQTHVSNLVTGRR